MAHKESRRSFFRTFIAGIAALPVLVGLSKSGGLSRAFAQDIPKKPVGADDAMAKQLGYVEDSTKVDKAANPTHAPEQKCSNCVLCVQSGLKIEGKPGDWCRCGLFSTGLVAAGGWCKSYAKKV